MGRQIGPLLIAAVALGMASCGGDGDEPVAPDAPQITKAGMIERGDALCRRDQARAATALAELPTPKPSASTEAILLPILEVNEEAIRTGAERIAAIGTPTSGAAALAKYLDERAAAAYALRTAIAAARKRETAEVEAALGRYLRNRAQQEARRFGFEVCGVGAGRLERQAAALAPPSRTE